MKVTKQVSAALILLAIVAVGISVSTSCNNDDNRTLSPDQMKQSKADTVKRIEGLNMPETTKKILESHSGGGDAGGADPGAQAAQSHGVNIPAGGRTH
jgi:hypothetical protein